MARTVSSRPRYREGRGLGEILSESLIFILMAVGLVAAGYWYFMVYRKSPQVALQNYLGAVNSGNTEAQYTYLSETSKKLIGSKDHYSDKFPLAYGMAARITNYSFSNATLSVDSWTADVNMNVRKKTSDLLNTATDSYTDKYVLRKESDGWKIVFEKPKIDFSKAENNR